jgi:hypothetical protein
MKSVYSAVRSGSLNKAVCALSLKVKENEVFVIKINLEQYMGSEIKLVFNIDRREAVNQMQPLMNFSVLCCVVLCAVRKELKVK